MKKILLLCGIVLCCLSSYAGPITLSASPASVVSPPPGGIAYVGFTVTAAGETSTSHITSVSYTTHANSVSPSTASFDGSIASANYYSFGSATNFAFHLTMISQSISQNYVVTYYIQMVTSDHSQSFATVNVTVTPSGIYYNVLQCGNYTKNNCSTGYYGSVVNYCVPINTYHSTASQAAADLQATNDISANGQTYANTHGSCISCAYTVSNIYIDAHPPYLALGSNTGVKTGGADHTVFFTFNGPSTTTFSIGATTQNIFFDPADPAQDNGNGTTTVSCDFYVTTTNGSLTLPITLKLTDVCGNVDSYVINVHYIP